MKEIKEDIHRLNLQELEEIRLYVIALIENKKKAAYLVAKLQGAT